MGVQASLIISTYNWPQALDLCLKSVSRQTVLPNEIIIADDGSSSETSETIKKYQTIFRIPVKHVWHEDLGFRKTVILNEAVRNSSFDYIIQIDGDVILEKHFIQDHLDCAERKTFVRGTRAMLTSEKTREILSSRKINLSFLSGGVQHRNNAMRAIPLKFLGIRKETNSARVRGSNLAFWKSDFIAVNGYNNDLLGWGHEDEELAARFINNGIVKKIVKLCAVQYHLDHPINNKDLKHLHENAVQRVVKNNIKRCTDGYER